MKRRERNTPVPTDTPIASNPPVDDGELSRRQFLTGVAAVAGALAVGGCGDSDGGKSATATPTALTPTSPAAPTGTATVPPAPTGTATAPPTASPTATAPPTASATASPAPSDTATPTPTDSPSPSPTSTPQDPETLPLPIRPSRASSTSSS